MPTWLSTPGTVLLTQHNRQSKYEPLVEEVELLDANPEYAHVKFARSRESTVSLQDLAQHGKTFDHSESITPIQLPNYNRNVEMNCETVVPDVNNEHSEICTEPLQIPAEESTCSCQKSKRGTEMDCIKYMMENLFWTLKVVCQIL